MKKNEPVDPRIDRLIAALYGELNDAEQADFEAQLAADPALRADWEEVSGTRNLLSGWELEERVPSFVVVPAVVTRPRVTGGWVSVLRERFGNWFSVGGWVMAGAAAAVLLMVAKDNVHVEKDNGQIALKFGAPAPATRPLPAGGHDAAGLDGGAQVVNDQNGGQYVTKNEMDQYSAAMLRMMTAYLNDYRGRRDQELGAALRSLYGNLNDRQASQYEDLLGKIDAARPGLPAEHEFLRPTELGMSHADSLGPLRLSPEDVEVGRNE